MINALEYIPQNMHNHYMYNFFFTSKEVLDKKNSLPGNVFKPCLDHSLWGEKSPAVPTLCQQSNSGQKKN